MNDGNTAVLDRTSGETESGDSWRGLQLVEQSRARIARGEGKVRPGQRLDFSRASTPGDCLPQGDLYVLVLATFEPEELANGIPEAAKQLIYPEYKQVTDFNAPRPDGTPDNYRKLAVDDTEGAKHILNNLEGVKMWRPGDWPNSESLEGPILLLGKDNQIDHPKHGTVGIPAGFLIEIGYQRTYDFVLKQERRAAD